MIEDDAVDVPQSDQAPEKAASARKSRSAPKLKAILKNGQAAAGQEAAENDLDLPDNGNNAE